MLQHRKRVQGVDLDLTQSGHNAEGVTSITVNLAEETYQLAQYTSMKVGGHSITFVPDPKKPLSEQMERMMDELREFTLKEFNVRKLEHISRLKK